ncbi:hypothetical protein D3C79_890830 [compost metagenome]
MPKFDRLTQYFLNKKYINMKEYSDLGIRIFCFKSRPVLILDITENKLCFYNFKIRHLSNTDTVESEIQWTSCKYLKENEWYGLNIDHQNDQLMEKLIDDFYSYTSTKSLIKNMGLIKIQNQKF